MKPQKWLALSALTALVGCGMLPPGLLASRNDNVGMLDGPPIEDIVTQFDDALSCLRGSIPRGLTFGVGQIVDSTGRESYADGATGRFITQGAGEMVQSALFRSGVSVINRRDPNITVVETQWGIRDIQLQIPVNFYVSGSINSLDFIPGGGVDITVAGVGSRYRQTRILIGLDLTLTDAFTGRIVASVPLQRQIFSSELGGSIGRFFNTTLVTMEAGRQEREAVHFVLRQMLNLATFELLSQVAENGQHDICREYVDPFYGNLGDAQRGDPYALQEALTVARQVADRRQNPTEAPAPAAQAAGQSAPVSRSLEEQLSQLSTQASLYAARAIAAAEESLAAETTEAAAESAARAMELMSGSVQLLRRAAEMGLSGPEGDAAAIVVERAVTVTQQAAEQVAVRTVREQRAQVAPQTLSPATPSQPGVPIPGTPEAARIGGG